jgi:hypothetical protein
MKNGFVLDATLAIILIVVRRLKEQISLKTWTLLLSNPDLRFGKL